MERYQQSVDNTVKTGKKHNKVILLVAFGSTWQRAFLAFDNTVAEYKKAFPDYDVFLSFSSAICINRAAAGEHAKDEGEAKAEVRHYYSPNFWLEAFGRVQYSEIIVQSLQVIPGEEYGRVINYMKDFANNSLGDLDDAYLKKVTLRLGLPLMADADKDVKALAKALDAGATYLGYSTPSPSLKGGTGLLELGYQFAPQDGRVRYGVNLMGMTGKRRGLAGSVQINWAF